MGVISVGQLNLLKSRLMFVALLEESAYEEIHLQPVSRVLTAYTPTFAIQAEFHLGAEMRVTDFLEAFSAAFLPVTNVKLFPLVPPKTELAVSRPFVLLNKKFITMYHVDEAK
jgi:hypothetical protein